MATRDPLIDWEQLDMIADGFPPDFVEIYREFEADFPRLLELVRSGLDSAEPAAVARAAHQAKGSCANFGFVAVSASLAEIERAAKSGVLDGLNAMLTSVEADFVESIDLVRTQRGV